MVKKLKINKKNNLKVKNQCVLLDSQLVIKKIILY